MMATIDSPSIENPNHYQDTKPQYLQESQDLYLHRNNHHQDESLETEPNSDLKNIMTPYSEYIRLTLLISIITAAMIFYPRVSGTSRIRDDFSEDMDEHDQEPI